MPNRYKDFRKFLAFSKMEGGENDGNEELTLIYNDFYDLRCLDYLVIILLSFTR